MAINILPEADVTVTASELRRYQEEYRRDYAFYAGTPPTLNEYIARRKRMSDEAREQARNQPLQ